MGDINADGNLDIVVGTEEIQGSTGNTSGRIYAFDGFTLATTHTATPLPGWPVTLPSLAASGVPAVATGVISSPALFPSTAGNGTLQTATGVFLAGSDAAHPAFTINSERHPRHDPSDQQLRARDPTSRIRRSFGRWPRPPWDSSARRPTPSSPADSAPRSPPTPRGRLARSPGSSTQSGPSTPRPGPPLPTFPRQIEDWQFLSGPAIADVKGDGTHQVIEGSGGGFLHAFDPASPPVGAQNNLSTSLSRYADGAEPNGFPVFTGGYITSTPTVGQLSRTGKVAVATVTRDGFLFLTDTDGRASANDQWWHFHHDERNTGLYGARHAAAGHGGRPLGAGRRQPGQRHGQMDRGRRRLVGRTGPERKHRPRWSTPPITDANFNSATAVAAAGPRPRLGVAEHVTVTGLPTKARRSTSPSVRLTTPATPA